MKKDSTNNKPEQIAKRTAETKTKKLLISVHIPLQVNEAMAEKVIDLLMFDAPVPMMADIDRLEITLNIIHDDGGESDGEKIGTNA